MAISCNCPHCGTSYRLKDDFAGKKVTCKNTACRKSFDIPKAKPQPVLTAKPVDVDALAAATFADEPKVEVKEETTVEVTCIGCDHVWKVEASKAGKNVLCPECGRPNKVPVPKPAGKADWRNTNDGRPTLARRDTAPKVAGAMDAGEVTTISMQTAQKIVREQDDFDEPEIVRARWIKRSIYGILISAIVGYSGYFLYTTRKVTKMDASIADALKEIRDPAEGVKDSKFHALILRASGEFHIRASEGRKDTDTALNDLKAARNVFPNVNDPSADRVMILSDIAMTMAMLLGTDEEAEKGKRIAKDALLKEIRQTLDRIPSSEPEPIYELLRNLTREFHKHKLGTMAMQLAVQKFSADTMESQEALGIVGLELYRLGDNAAAEEVLAKTTKDEAGSIQALRKLLNKPAPVPPQPKTAPTPKGVPVKEVGPPPQSKFTPIIQMALKGELGKIKGFVGKSGTDLDRVKAFLLAADLGIPVDPKTPIPPEVGDLLEAAIPLFSGDSKNTISGWFGVKLCRLLVKVGKLDKVNAVADLIQTEPIRAWAKLEALRVRLNSESDKDKKAEEAWADAVGDPAKSAAAAKARELIARQNAFVDGSFKKTVDGWTKGSIRPYGIAGLMLGQQDRTFR